MSTARHISVDERSSPSPSEPPPDARNKPRVQRSLVARTVLAGCVGLTFGSSVVLGALAHVGLAPARRIVATLLTDVLSATFAGRVVIERIDHIDERGFEGGRRAG